MNKLLVIAIACGALVGCGGGDSSRTQNPDNANYLNYMKARYSEIAGNDYDAQNIPSEAIVTSPTLDEASTSDGFSRTNVQVSGVDEADLIEFDGDVLMTLNRSLNTYYYDPEAFTATPTVRVFDEATLEGERGEDANLHLQLSDEYRYTGVISYDNNSAIIGHRSHWWGYVEDAPYCLDCNRFTDNSIMVKLWQHKDENGAIPANTRDVIIEGQLIDIRAIDNTLTIISRYTPDLDVTYYPQTHAQRSANQDKIDNLTLDDLTPSITINGNSQAMLDDANCHLPDNEVQAGHIPDLILITQIDMRDAQQWQTTCTLHGSQRVFVSHNNIYLAASRWWSEQVVDITKFSIDADGVQYRASGTVSGHLSGDSYHFGEVDGNLVLVNSYYDDIQGNALWWGWGNERHQLSILQENGDQLELLSQIPNATHPAPIGKPDEQIYAVRILGHRAYVVTFEKTDPLYVIDLSDTAAPTILGELEIPGFSSYLHPISENLILGVGKNAVLDNGFSWFQGLNIRLFDVSDPQSPTMVESLDYGLRGSQSEIIYDPHAFSYLMDNSTGIARLTIPMTLNGDASAHDPEQHPSTYYPPTETGLYQFEVDTHTPALREVARAVRTENLPDWYFSSGDRAVINGDSVYYAHGNTLDVLNWGENDIVRRFELTDVASQ